MIDLFSNIDKNPFVISNKEIADAIAKAISPKVKENRLYQCEVEKILDYGSAKLKKSITRDIFLSYKIKIDRDIVYVKVGLDSSKNTLDNFLGKGYVDVQEFPLSGIFDDIVESLGLKFKKITKGAILNSALKSLGRNVFFSYYDFYGLNGGLEILDRHYWQIGKDKDGVFRAILGKGFFNNTKALYVWDKKGFKKILKKLYNKLSDEDKQKNIKSCLHIKEFKNELRYKRKHGKSKKIKQAKTIDKVDVTPIEIPQKSVSLFDFVA